MDVKKQYAAAGVALLFTVCYGACEGFSSILLAQLRTPNSTVLVSDEEASWIASVFLLPGPLGSLTVAVLMRTLGRTRIVQLAYLPMFFGWAIIARADSSLELCVGRFMTGFSVGMEPAAIVYVTEVMLTPKHRSAMLSLLSPIFYAGVALAYFAAYWLRWRHEAALVSSMAAVGFVAMLVVPETPFWLASNDRAEEAGEALRWLTSDAAYADEELARLRKAAGLGGDGDTLATATASLPRLVLETGAWKPFLLIVAFLFFQQFSGYKVLIFYTVSFYESFGTPVDAYLSAVVFAALVVCSSLALTVLLDSLGRRTLMATSAGGVCALCAAAAGHAYAFRGLPCKPLPWLPLACLWLNVVFGTMGLNTLTWIMAGEMFPAAVRGPMVSLVWSVAFLLMFASVKIYPASARLLHVHGVLAVFSAVAFTAFVCTLVALPETRGKSSQQIESLWLPRRRSVAPSPPPVIP